MRIRDPLPGWILVVLLLVAAPGCGADCPEDTFYDPYGDYGRGCYETDSGPGDDDDVVGDDDDGWTIADGDCDDDDPESFPGNAEVCDDRDNDCDGNTDEGLFSPWYPDRDHDGYGGLEEPEVACSAPPGHAASSDDCDDDDPDVHPGASEWCNDGLDTDCDLSAGDEAGCSWAECSCDCLCPCSGAECQPGITIDYDSDLSCQQEGNVTCEELCFEGIWGDGACEGHPVLDCGATTGFSGSCWNH